MEITVVWTAFAIEKLSEIYEYYLDNASVLVAERIVDEIVEKTLYLEKHSTIGQLESLLSNRKKEYRYLVEGNYKIIYSKESNFISIATVFDTRQNPQKILK